MRARIAAREGSERAGCKRLFFQRVALRSGLSFSLSVHRSAKNISRIFFASKFGENFLVTDLVAETFEESDEEKKINSKTNCRDLKDLPKFPSSVAIHVREKNIKSQSFPL